MNLKEKKNNKNKLSKQLQQEQNHMEGFQWGGGRKEWGRYREEGKKKMQQPVFLNGQKISNRHSTKEGVKVEMSDSTKCWWVCGELELDGLLVGL